MMPLYCRIKTLTMVLFIALTIGSCASKNYLVVNYQLPSETIRAKETEIVLIFKDQRAEQAIVTQSAKMALKDFSGNFALIVTSDSKNERLVGAFSLSSLMKSIFTQRLKNAGIRVASEDQGQATALEIILKAFKLDLVERKWVVQMSYQANFLKHNRFVSGETITGNAERLRVVGSKDAEKVIGELMTDAVNRLDLDALFRSAGN
ncbi:MAG: hypothetical protein PVG68_04050 [Desulfobacterales bacterium]|jgi:hypothetical protein